MVIWKSLTLIGFSETVVLGRVDNYLKDEQYNHSIQHK